MTRPIAGALALAAAALAAPAAATAGYGWPVAPFDRAHPIRSTFGDPRTTFRGPPTAATIYRGAGSFSFHNGVDVAAPDGSSVYAVASGVVVSTAGRRVVVRSGGTVFQYAHIVPSVAVGRRVVAFVDVLGRIRRGYGHVHLAEIERGQPTNPLAPGHLTPYADHTTPVVERLVLRRAGTTRALFPELVRGTIELDVPVFDLPRPAAPGWEGMATAPALVRWRVQRAATGRAVVAERDAFDVRLHLPVESRFWSAYARGTRQNAATFLGHRYWRQDGLLLFRLGVVDTRKLRDGIYTVVVSAADVRGNSSVRRTTFLVYNHRRWPPPTPQA